MSASIETRVPPDPAEIERITALYRQGGYERHTPPITVYHDQHVYCPWPGCGLVIRVLAYNGWEARWDDATRERLLKAFWLGSGLLAACPHCGRGVLFSLLEKQMATDPGVPTQARLPDDWLRVGMVKPCTLETAPPS